MKVLGIKKTNPIISELGNSMSRTKQEKNKALVLEAFDTLFNKREYTAAERYWSPAYIQHSAHIAPGRGGLFNLIKSLPPTLKYEPGTIVAEGDLVIVHGRLAVSVHLQIGLPQILCALRTESLSSIGTSFRMKRRKNSRRVKRQCLVTHFQHIDLNTAD
jgi:hypothetical protein